MAAGARRWTRREKGSRARQRNSSLLASARQLQALVRQHARTCHSVSAARAIERSPKYARTTVPVTKNANAKMSTRGNANVTKTAKRRAVQRARGQKLARTVTRTRSAWCSKTTVPPVTWPSHDRPVRQLVRNSRESRSGVSDTRAPRPSRSSLARRSAALVDQEVSARSANQLSVRDRQAKVEAMWI